MTKLGSITANMRVGTARGNGTVEKVKTVQQSVGYGKFDAVGLVVVRHDDRSLGVYKHADLTEPV